MVRIRSRIRIKSGSRNRSGVGVWGRSRVRVGIRNRRRRKVLGLKAIAYVDKLQGKGIEENMWAAPLFALSLLRGLRRSWRIVCA